MWTRRHWLAALAAAVPARGAAMTPRERVDRALRGQDVDRPPFTLWYHFGLEKMPASHHARATLDFQRKFRTDLVKVMSDYPYPKPEGGWKGLRELANPFPEQTKALEAIRDGLDGTKYFVETIFNPWNVAEKLFGKEEVLRMKNHHPQRLLDVLTILGKSEANHARRAMAAGASGIFLAVANAQEGILTRAEYARFSEPFDRMVLAAVADAPLNVLHLHGDKVYLDHFYKGWPPCVLHYSAHGTGVGLGEVRRKFAGVLMGGVDERNFRALTEAQIRQEWQTARHAAGARFIAAPGCSVPNETKDDEVLRMTRALGA